MESKLIEEVSAKVHEVWMETKKAQGVTSRKSEKGEELMVPYSDLSEAAKDLDRGSVKATLKAVEAAGYQITKLGMESTGKRHIARAQAPHCDSLVLHKPGSCKFCDLYPERQQGRIAAMIRFTGESEPVNFAMRPAEARRSIDTIHHWYGNTPKPK